MRKENNNSYKRGYFSKLMILFENIEKAKFSRISSLSGLAFILNFSVVNAEPEKSLPYLNCSVPGQEQKEVAVLSNLDQISLNVKLGKTGERPFQKLWIPSSKRDWQSRAFGIDKMVDNSKKFSKELKGTQQTVFVKVISAASKEEIPFTVVSRGIGERLEEETLFLLLEIPLDSKTKQTKIDEFFRQLDQKGKATKEKSWELSQKEKYNRFKRKRYLENSISEHRVGKFIIECQYIVNMDKFWKGKLTADPLVIEIENKGSFWDRLTAENKKIIMGGLASKPQATKPKIVLNTLGKELEAVAYRFPDRPGKADLPKVIEGLNDSLSSTKQMALRVLVQAIIHNRALEAQGHEKEVDLDQHPKVLTSLLKMVRASNPKDRSGAIGVLSIGFQPSEKIQNAVFDQTKIEGSREVRMSILHFIKQVGAIPKERQSFLIDMLNSKDKVLSKEAAITMGAIQMESGLPHLVGKFEASRINGNFQTYYRAIYLYKNSATPYLPKLEGRLMEVNELLNKTRDKKDKRKIRFIQSGLRNVIDKIRKLKSNG